MGDDYPDLELFDAVGFAASVPNAIEKVKEKADYVTKTTVEMELQEKSLI